MLLRSPSRQPNWLRKNGYGPVHVTGHSLGGALAQITAHHYNLPGDAFNPYGAAGLAYRLPEGQPANAAPFTNHVMAGDLVSAGGPHYGKVEMYALPKELEVLRTAEQGQRIASLGAPGLKRPPHVRRCGGPVGGFPSNGSFP